MLRRSEIFIVMGTQIAVSSGGAASNRDPQARKSVCQRGGEGMKEGEDKATQIRIVFGIAFQALGARYDRSVPAGRGFQA